MEKIIDQKHPKQLVAYASSRFFERAAYYGLRSLIVLYMLSESFQMERSEAFTIYGWFTGLIISTQIIGAIVGDLMIGNRITLIIGGIVQAIGAFILCIPSMEGLYTGLALVLLGGGFYSPNLLSQYGKLYHHKPKLLDSGFSILYLAINFGAFIGPITIGYLGENVDWSAGFITAGIIMLISILFPLFSKETTQVEKIGKYIQANYKVILVLVVITLSGIFWTIYDLSYVGIKDIELRLSEYSTMNIPISSWSSIMPAFSIPIGIVLAILWTIYYSKSIVKLSIGFFFGAISFGLLILIPDIPNDSYIILFIISNIFLSLSELYIAPIVLSILTKYSNPKYLAILMSVAFIPIRLFSFILTFLHLREGFYEEPTSILIISAITLLFISIALAALIISNTKKIKENTL